MVIEGNHITADDGKALRRKGSTDASEATEAWLAPTDSPDNWEECDYGIADEPTMEDKDAALRRFGVEV